MTSRFEPDQGRLVMSHRTLQALGRFDAGFELHPEILDELVDAGAVQGGRITEALAGLARCTSRPLVRLVGERAGRPSSQLEGWIDDRLAVLLYLPAGAAEGDVVAVPKGMTGFRLARLMGLGPRSAHKVRLPVEIDAGLLEVLLVAGSSFEPSEVERSLRRDEHLEPGWTESLSALSRADATRWNVGVWWNAADERPKARTLDLIDSSVGMFLVSVVPRGDSPVRRVELRPLTPSQAWRLLCALVPPADHVSEPLAIE